LDNNILTSSMFPFIPDAMHRARATRKDLLDHTFVPIKIITSIWIEGGVGEQPFGLWEIVV
jgi:hypothetical protein